MRMPKPPGSKTFNRFQQARGICLKYKLQKTGAFIEAPESALGAGVVSSNLAAPTNKSDELAAWWKPLKPACLRAGRPLNPRPNVITDSVAGSSTTNAPHEYWVKKGNHHPSAYCLRRRMPGRVSSFAERTASVYPEFSLSVSYVPKSQLNTVQALLMSAASVVEVQ